MSWYSTCEEAEKACEWKEKEYKCKFYVLKDSIAKDTYWAQRKIPTEMV
jgi:hypothetical protein